MDAPVSGTGKRSLSFGSADDVDPPPTKATRTKEPPSQWTNYRMQRTNDEVHSSIIMNPVLQAFLDTPQMQRLRGLKQLGTADYVFINTNHTRFEHSLGVSSLASTLCSRIAKSQPCLLCTAMDELCVQLAGLMHDIGHGPFSHHYERFVDHQRDVEFEGLPGIPPNWGHEDASLMMIDSALEHLGFSINLDALDEPLQKIRPGVESLFAEDGTEMRSRDFVFVKECIVGKPVPELEAKLGPGFHGRTKEYQEWLYDIVANRRHGLDVDKIDYFARDQRRALRESGEIDKVMIEEALVAWAVCPDPSKCHRCDSRQPGKHLMVCYPKKLVTSCMDFFKTRFTLHGKIYQHKTNNAVSFLIRDLLSKADPFFTLPVRPLVPYAPGGPKVDYESLPISRAMNHPGAYIQLQDSIVQLIAADRREELAPAHELAYRLSCRDFYKFAGMQVLHPDRSEVDKMIWAMSDADIVDQLLEVDIENGNCSPKHTSRNGRVLELKADDIRVHKCSIHHGQKSDDPLKMMRFVDKTRLSKISVKDYKDLPEAFMPHEDEYYSRLPRSLMERSIRVYATTKEKQGLVEHVFGAWWFKLHDGPPTTDTSHPAFLTQDDSDSEPGSPQCAVAPWTRTSVTPIQQNIL